MTSNRTLWDRQVRGVRGGRALKLNRDGQPIVVVRVSEHVFTSNADGELDDAMRAEYDTNQ